MNYIELIKQFWQCNNELPIGCNATALYFYLLKVCNSLGWKETFKHSDRYIAIQLGISINTVRTAKNKLKQLGLIDFKSPEKASKGLDGSTRYMILTISNFDSVPDTDADTDADSVPDTDADTRNKLNKTKLNNNKNYTKNEVEEIYSLYPGKCVVKGSSTGKCEKNKDRIKKLLNTISADGIKRTIIWYIDDCKRHNTYMKNFSTFLNNIPEIPTSAEDRKCKWNTPNGDRVSVYSQFLIDQNRYGVDNVKFIGYAD